MKAYKCTARKGHFPHEWLDSLEKLWSTELPSNEAFYSQLRGQNITGAEYAECQRVWRENEMESMRDYLIWYNNLDVDPFVEALIKIMEFW